MPALPKIAACLPLFLLAGISSAPGAAGSRAVPAQGAGVRCLSVDRITSRRPIGPRALLFETAEGRYRNDLPAECPGLARRTGDFDVVQLEVDGGQVCSGDSFRAFDPAEARAVGAGAFPRCRLGAFTRIDAR